MPCARTQGNNPTNAQVTQSQTRLRVAILRSEKYAPRNIVNIKVFGHRPQAANSGVLVICPKPINRLPSAKLNPADFERLKFTVLINNTVFAVKIITLNKRCGKSVTPKISTKNPCSVGVTQPYAVIASP